MRLYSEMDLVAAEALRSGVLDDLPTSGLAAALSVLVFEARRPDGDAPRIPGGAIRQAIEALDRIAGTVQDLERRHRVEFTRRPDAGFAWATYRWAEGDDLDEVLGVTDLAAGDFVRWMKQVIDMAGQVADAAGAGPVRDTARDVVRALRRGVVAYSRSWTERYHRRCRWRTERVRQEVSPGGGNDMLTSDRSEGRPRGGSGRTGAASRLRACGRLRTAPERHARGSTRHYGDPPVRVPSRIERVRIRFEGRAGDQVSLQGSRPAASSCGSARWGSGPPTFALLAAAEPGDVRVRLPPVRSGRRGP